MKENLTQKEAKTFRNSFVAWTKEQICLGLACASALRFPIGGGDGKCWDLEKGATKTILWDGDTPSKLDEMVEAYEEVCKSLGGFPVYLDFLQQAFREMAESIRPADDMRLGMGGFKPLWWCFEALAEKASWKVAQLPPCQGLQDWRPYLEAFPGFASSFWAKDAARPGAFFAKER